MNGTHRREGSMKRPYRVERTLVPMPSKKWLVTAYSTLDKAMAAAKFWESITSHDARPFYVRVSHIEQGVLYPSAPTEREK